MNYINFSTNFQITINWARLYLIIYSHYYASETIYNNEVSACPNLKLLSGNYDSEKTSFLMNAAEEEVYEFINSWSETIYQLSKTREREHSASLKDCFRCMYIDVIKHEMSTFQYGAPFFDLHESFLNIQESIRTICQSLQDLDSINFLEVLIELKLIASLFTFIKNIIFNVKTPRPTPIQ